MEFYHAWTTELHSLTRVPDTWQHPVGMLLREADGSKLTATDSSDGDKENEPDSAEVSVPLPLPLPLTCPRAHLHKLGPTEQVTLSLARDGFCHDLNVLSRYVYPIL